MEPLACLRVQTEQGFTGLAEVFRVPPGVVQATVRGAGTMFGKLLVGQEVTHPERLWQRTWEALLHTNRRGWEGIIVIARFGLPKFGVPTGKDRTIGLTSRPSPAPCRVRSCPTPARPASAG